MSLRGGWEQAGSDHMPHTLEIVCVGYTCVSCNVGSQESTYKHVYTFTWTADSVVIVFEKSSVKAQEYTEKGCFVIKAVGDFSSPFDITVECSPASSRPATPGDDFNADPITVQFTPNKKSQTVCVPVVDDDECEKSERFVCAVRKSSLPGFGTTRGRVTVNIADSSKREDDCRGKYPHSFG